MANIIKNKNLSGSITVEASIVFTISILILFMSFAPLFVLKSSAKIIKDLNEISKAASIYKMIKYNFENDRGSTNVDNLKKEEIQNNTEIDYLDNEISREDLSESFENLTNIGIVIYKLLEINKDKNDAFSNISYILPLQLDTFDSTKQVINYKLKVGFKIPFNIFTINNLYQDFYISRRAFVGADGNRYDSEDSGEYIYIAESFERSHVYHNNINCTILKKVTKEVVYADIDKEKNEYGDSYIKCEYCIKNEKLKSDTVVFTTQYGKLFHLNENCPTMTAYVSKVSKDYIEKYDLRLCKICERKKSDESDDD